MSKFGLNVHTRPHFLYAILNVLILEVNPLENLTVHKMTKPLAEAILCWKYDKPYDFYNNELSDEALSELLDGSYNAILNEQNCLIGFFCLGKNAQVPIGHQYDVYKDAFIDLGLGMDPKLVGKGLGYIFCAAILTFVEQKYARTPIRLTVANFNIRAIKLYKNLGFVQKNEFNTNVTSFTTMVRSTSTYAQ